MAASYPTDSEANNSPKKPLPWRQFIRTTRVPQRGRKSKDRFEKLLNKFENKLSTVTQIEGVVHASPSAPPPYEENDSDCESWGSDFDDDEVVEDISWEPQEEIENDINTMLEAAMERNKNLENSQLARSGAVREAPARSDARLAPARRDLPAVPSAPPPRNTSVASGSMAASRNQQIRTLSETATPVASIISSEQKLRLKSAIKKQATPQGNVPTIPESHPTGTSQPSTSATNSPGRRVPSDASRAGAPAGRSVEANRTFPPDVTNTAAISPTSSGLLSSVIATSSSSFPRQGATTISLSSSTNRGSASSNDTAQQASQVRNPHTPEFRKPELGRPQRSTETTVPPPLPSRPPPVRFPVNKPVVRSNLLHPTGAADSLPKDDVPFSQRPRQPIPNSSVTSQISKNSSSSFASLRTESSLQNSSVVETPERTSGTSAVRPSAQDLVMKLPSKKSEAKVWSVPFGVPKILKELDAAVLKQVVPTRRSKSATSGEIQHSLESTGTPPIDENNDKEEEATNDPSDDYLNPKELAAAGPPEFVPDRPTLPRRLKQSRSLPFLNLVDNFRRVPSKSDISADERSHQKSQDVNGTPENNRQASASNDDLLGQPWYHPISWTQTQLKLTTMSQDGAFLVRPSSRLSGDVPCTISVYFRGRIINCHISSTPDKKFVLGKLKPNQKAFDTITDLIRYYQSNAAELKISENEPVSKVWLMITPPKETDKIYADI